ncbi:glycoside hydrolase family 13 protein [Robiginitalea sp. SC105]|uniref:glycoside hydrolase family 13 protein n=1 Tax=Robiginitalea sp. SC105 TaxID=2762332 RepID=UPI00163B60FC|nr:glycoside hydrolase family 13 protein [Robiginitalea sp. SC105]MBC2837852.1 glycoside hydrolase family 13 protein [Robiginitalea sp. SC105]
MASHRDLQAQLRVEPPNWWAGMQADTLQLMLYGPGLSAYTADTDYPGLQLVASHPGDSPNYLFLDLVLGPELRPGTATLRLSKSGSQPMGIEFPFLQRVRPGEAYQGFGPGDVLYLITPDRFANGDPANDSVPGMRETGVDRGHDYARHGGDIRGITEHLDYIADMGFTAIWPSPLLTNDMASSSYHGYAITDFYGVDPRFGSLAEYLELAEEARKRGVKIIMDQVVNHIGVSHWWMEDLPFADWVHFQDSWKEGERPEVTNHRRTVNQDRYASVADRELMDRGWFVPTMPDLNQDNPFLANYLIQNSIWWVETLGLGGIRQDTYPYPSKEFMARWARSVMAEYPNFNIVGEEWSYNPLLVGYWQDGARNRDGYRSYLRSTMDFPLQRTLVEALTTDENWDSGLNLLYEGLANDFHYARPEDLLFFGDNHDMDRIHTQLGESVPLTEMALAFVLTAPRTPQVYYGTEILMSNSDKPGDHGRIRTDFPGGWEGDRVDAFTGKGLKPSQKGMQSKLRNLLRYRRESPAIHSGATLHFAPEDGIYVLARRLESETVLLLLNKNDTPVTLDTRRFAELGLAGAKLREVLTGTEFLWDESVNLPYKGAYVLTTAL